jgi:hypothetical protein
VGIRGRIGPGRDAGVGGEPFANLVASVRCPPRREIRAARSRLKASASAIASARRLPFDSTALRSARHFELHPDATFERIEMRL